MIFTFHWSLEMVILMSAINTGLVQKITEYQNVQCELKKFYFLPTSKKWIVQVFPLTLLLMNMTCPVLANGVDPDQLASDLDQMDFSRLSCKLD